MDKPHSIHAQSASDHVIKASEDVLAKLVDRNGGKSLPIVPVVLIPI